MVTKLFLIGASLDFPMIKLHDAEFRYTTLVNAYVPEATLEAFAKMRNSTTSELELKLIQRVMLGDESFTTFCFMIFHCLRKTSKIFVSQSNPLFHSYWFNNLIFTITGAMRPIGSKIKFIALKMFLFASGTTLFETFNLSISVLESQVISSAMYVGNSWRSKFTT